MATGKTCLILEWTLLVLSLLLVCTRLVFHSRKGINVSDGFVIVGWLFFLGQTGMDTALYNLGRYEGKIDPMAAAFGPEHGLLTYQQTVTALKILFAENVTYYCEMYCVKGAMIAFYYRLIPKCLVTHRIALHTIAGITLFGWLFTVLINIFGCNPIGSQWAVGPAMCWLPSWAWNTICGLHIGTDLMIYILPLFVLHILDMRLPQKLGVALTFSMGFACIIFATLVQVSFMTGMPATTSNIFAALEQSWAIFIVCMPALKCLLRSEMYTGVSNIRSVLSIGRKSQDDKETKSVCSDNGTDIERLGSMRSMSTASGMPKHKPLPVSMVITEDEVKVNHAKENGW